MNSGLTQSSEESSATAGNIILIGLMGAGKTSVGKALARTLNKSFYDSDQEIERATGVKIPVIFEIEGEAGFRARESRVLAQLLALQDIVLATGGGAVIAKANRDLISRRGTVIYLRAPVKALLRRTQHDRNRPLLQVADPLSKLTELYEQRDPLYREAADLIVDTNNQSVRTLVEQIRDKLHTLDNKSFSLHR